MKRLLNQSEKKEIKEDVISAIEQAKENPLNKKQIDKLKRKKINPIIAIIIIITIFTIALYYYISNNPKTALLITYNNFFSKIENNINNDLNQGQINIESQNKKTQINYISSNKETLSKISNSTIYTENDKTYILTPEITDKYILLKTKGYNINLNKINNKINSIKQLIYNHINTKTYYPSKKTIEIGSKKINSIIYTIDFETEEYNKIIYDINQIFQIKSIINNLSSKENIKLKIYSETFTNNFIKCEIIQNNTPLLKINKLSDNKLQLIINNKEKISISNNKINIFKKPKLTNYIEFDKLNENQKQNLNKKLENNTISFFTKSS